MYNYPDQIKSASKAGIKDRGTWSQVGKNIKGMESYFKILGEGGGKASKHKKTNEMGGMGNRYFVKANGKCSTGETRHIYMDHIPTSDTSQSVIFDKQVGLIPGLTNNVLSSIDPTAIMNAVSQGSSPECVKVRLTEVNSAGKLVKPGDDDYKWMSVSEANNIDPCWYDEKKRIYKDRDEVDGGDGKTCGRRDGFANIKDNHTMAEHAMDVSQENTIPLFPTDTPSTAVPSPPLDSAETLYVALLSGVGLYAAYRLAIVLK